MTEYATVWGNHIRPAATFDPATQGAIASVDYQEDAILVEGGGDGQAAGLARRQGARSTSAIRSRGSRLRHPAARQEGREEAEGEAREGTRPRRERRCGDEGRGDRRLLGKAEKLLAAARAALDAAVGRRLVAAACRDDLVASSTTSRRASPACRDPEPRRPARLW